MGWLLRVCFTIGLFCRAVTTDSCRQTDEFIRAGQTYEYVYRAAVRISTHYNGSQDAVNSNGSTVVWLRCTLFITGTRTPCQHALQIDSCSVDDNTTGDMSWRDAVVTESLNKNVAHFRLENSRVKWLRLSQRESQEVTNIRRATINLFRVSIPLLNNDDNVATQPGASGDCRQWVSRMDDDLYHVTRSADCDPQAHLGSPTHQSLLLTLAKSVGVLEEWNTTCDYRITNDQLTAVECAQSRDLHLSSHHLTRVMSTQKLLLKRWSAVADWLSVPPLGGALVPVDFVPDHSSQALPLTNSTISVSQAMTRFVEQSVPRLGSSSPAQFNDLVTALRSEFNDPLLFATGCRNCSRLQKEVSMAAALSALLQCGSAPCLRSLTHHLPTRRVSPTQLATLLAGWIWQPSDSADQLSARLQLCQQLAAARAGSFASHWCQLIVSADSALQSPHLSPAASRTQLVRRMWRHAVRHLSPSCQGPTASVLLAIKTIANLMQSPLMWSSFASSNETRDAIVSPITALSLCVTNASLSSTIVVEAMQTLTHAAVRDKPIVVRLLKEVLSERRHASVSRQLAFLTLVRVDPSSATLTHCVHLANQLYPHSVQMALFIVRHVYVISQDTAFDEAAAAAAEFALLSARAALRSHAADLSQPPAPSTMVKRWRLPLSSWPGLGPELGFGRSPNPLFLLLEANAVFDEQTAPSHPPLASLSMLPRFISVEVTLQSEQQRQHERRRQRRQDENDHEDWPEEPAWEPLDKHADDDHSVWSARIQLHGDGLGSLLSSLASRRQLEQIPTIVQLLAKLLAEAAGGDALARHLSGAWQDERLQLLRQLGSTAAGWLNPLLQQAAAAAAANSSHMPADSSVLSVIVGGRQLLMLTTEQLLELLAPTQLSEEAPQLLGTILKHAQMFAKPVQLHLQIPSMSGLATAVVVDSTAVATWSVDWLSRMQMSDTNILQLFHGNLLAHAGCSAEVLVVVSARVLSSSRAAAVQRHVITAAPAPANITYHTHERVLTLHLHQPTRTTTMLQYSHSVHSIVGDMDNLPSPQRLMEFKHNTDVTAATYTYCLPSLQRLVQLSVCVHHSNTTTTQLSSADSRVFSLSLTNTRTDSRAFTVQLWSSARADGYIHGGAVHVLARAASPGAPPLHFTYGFRLKPVNFNDQLFARGQKVNNTVDIVLGDIKQPLGRCYFRYAQTEIGSSLFSEVISQVEFNHVNYWSLSIKRNESMDLPVAERRTSDLWATAAWLSHHVNYTHKTMISRLGETSAMAYLGYTSEQDQRQVVSLLESMLHPVFYDQRRRSAHILLNFSSSFSADTEMRAVSWHHCAGVYTAHLGVEARLLTRAVLDTRRNLSASFGVIDLPSRRSMTSLSANAEYGIETQRGGSVVRYGRGSLTSSAAGLCSAVGSLNSNSDGSLALNTSVQCMQPDNIGDSARGVFLTASWRPAEYDAANFAVSLAVLHGSARSGVSEVRRIVLALTGRMAGLPLDQCQGGQLLPWQRHSAVASFNISCEWRAQLPDDAAAAAAAGLTVDGSWWLLNSSRQLQLFGRAAAAGVSVQLQGQRLWRRPTLYGWSARLNSPLLNVNHTLKTIETQSGGVRTNFNYHSQSSSWHFLNAHFHGRSVSDGVSAAKPARAHMRQLSLNLAHQWATAHVQLSRQPAMPVGSSGNTATSAPKFRATIDSKVDILPSLQCSLAEDGQIEAILSLPARSAPTVLDLDYKFAAANQQTDMATRSISVDVSVDGRAPVTGAYFAVQMAPHNLSQVTFEFDANPGALMTAARQLVRLAGRARIELARNLADSDWLVNRLFRPISGQQTLADWWRHLPSKLSAIFTSIYDSLASLFSPWSVLVTPLTDTLTNVYKMTRQTLSQLKLTFPISVASNEGRTWGAFIAGWLRRGSHRLYDLLPVSVSSQRRRSRTRVVVSLNHSSHVDLKSIWPSSWTFTAQNANTTCTDTSMINSALLWTSGEALLLNGSRVRTPECGQCGQVLLADVDAARLATLRVGSFLHLSLVDCHVTVLMTSSPPLMTSSLANVAVRWRHFTHKQRRQRLLQRFTEISVSPDNNVLSVRTVDGILVHVYLRQQVVQLRVPAWLVPRTMGILAGNTVSGCVANDINDSSHCSSSRLVGATIVDDRGACGAGDSEVGGVSDARQSLVDNNGAVNLCQTPDCQMNYCDLSPSETSSQPREALVNWRVQQQLETQPHAAPLRVAFVTTTAQTVTSPNNQLTVEYLLALKRHVTALSGRQLAFSQLTNDHLEHAHRVQWSDSFKNISLDGASVVPAESIVPSLVRLMTASSPSYFSLGGLVVVVLTDASKVSVDHEILISAERLMKRLGLVVHVVTSFPHEQPQPISAECLSPTDSVSWYDICDVLGGDVWHLESSTRPNRVTHVSRSLAARVWQWMVSTEPFAGDWHRTDDTSDLYMLRDAVSVTGGVASVMTSSTVLHCTTITFCIALIAHCCW